MVDDGRTTDECDEKRRQGFRLTSIIAMDTVRRASYVQVPTLLALFASLLFQPVSAVGHHLDQEGKRGSRLSDCLQIQQKTLLLLDESVDPSTLLFCTAESNNGKTATAWKKQIISHHFHTASQRFSYNHEASRNQFLEYKSSGFPVSFLCFFLPTSWETILRSP